MSNYPARAYRAIFPLASKPNSSFTPNQYSQYDDYGVVPVPIARQAPTPAPASVSRMYVPQSGTVAISAPAYVKPPTFMEAVSSGNYARVTELFKDNWDARKGVPPDDMSLAITIASKRRDKEMVRLLVRQLTWYISGYYKLLLDTAIDNQDMFVLDTILERMAQDDSGRAYFSMDTLLRAIKTRNLAIIDKLLSSQKLDFGYRDTTPDMDEIYNELEAEGRQDIINRLLKHPRLQYHDPDPTQGRIRRYQYSKNE